MIILINAHLLTLSSVDVNFSSGHVEEQEKTKPKEGEITSSDATV